MAFVGTVLGYQSDKAVWKYFLRHWAAGFPSLGDRSTFVRQLANLGHIEAFLHQHWARTLEAFAAKVHLVDGFPVPVCHPRRVGRRTLFRGEAGWGFCASKGNHYFGFHGHLLTTADSNIEYPRGRHISRNVTPSLTCRWSKVAGRCSATKGSSVPF